MRPSGRAPDQLRDVTLEIGVSRYAEGSCLARFGQTLAQALKAPSDQP